MGEYFTSRLFCLQRKHPAYEYFLTFCFPLGGVVSASSYPQAGGPPLVDCLQLLIQFIRSYPPNWRPFLHPQPEDAPCSGDRDPQTQEECVITFLKLFFKIHHSLTRLHTSTYCEYWFVFLYLHLVITLVFTLGQNVAIPQQDFLCFMKLGTALVSN